MTGDNQERIERTAIFAAQAHKGQTRRWMPDTPYVVHVERVARAAHAHGLSADAVEAAYLHDVVEDTPFAVQDVQEACGCTPRTIELVTLLTKWWPSGTPPKAIEQQKAIYYERIIKDDEAIVLKLLDRTDNLGDLLRILEREPPTKEILRWAERYLYKTDVEFPPLVARCPVLAVAGTFAQQYASAKIGLWSRRRQRD